MAIKEPISVYVDSNKVVNYPADADFTTDAIEWKDFKGFTINIWYNSLIGGNPKPKLTIQVSNSIDANSFTNYNYYIGFNLPDSFQKDSLEYKYIRFVYTSRGVDDGSLITFNLNRNSL